MNRRREKNVKNKISINLILIIAGVISVFLTKYLVEAKRQDDIRNIGYKINSYRREVRRTKSRNAKLRSELEKIKKPDVIMAMLRKYGIKLTMPNLERTTTITLKRGKKMARRQLVTDQKSYNLRKNGFFGQALFTNFELKIKN